MPSEDDVRKTIQHYEARLFADENVTYISAREVGTGACLEWVIEIGVVDPQASVLPPFLKLPSTGRGKTGSAVPVIIVQSGAIEAL